MGANNIQRCDHTFNPSVGCTKVSAACDHCYAESLRQHALGSRIVWTRRTSAYRRKQIGAQPLKWNRTAADAGVRQRVFCASLPDVFDIQDVERLARRLCSDPGHRI